MAAVAVLFAFLANQQRDVAQQETRRADAFITLVDANPAGRSAMEKICEEAIKVTSTLATTSDKSKLDSSLSRFWELYYGPMYIIEIHQAKKLGQSEIESSMVTFGSAIEKATEPLPHSSLCPYAKAVRDNCIAYLKVTAPEPCS